MFSQTTTTTEASLSTCGQSGCTVRAIERWWTPQTPTGIGSSGSAGRRPRFTIEQQQSEILGRNCRRRIRTSPFPFSAPRIGIGVRSWANEHISVSELFQVPVCVMAELIDQVDLDIILVATKSRGIDGHDGSGTKMAENTFEHFDS